MLPAFPSEAEARHEEGFLNSADHLRLFWQRYTPASAAGDGARAPRGGRPLRPLPGAHRRARPRRLPGGAARPPRPRPVRRPPLAHRRLRATTCTTSTRSSRSSPRTASPASGSSCSAHSQGALIAALWGLRHAALVSGFVLSVAVLPARAPAAAPRRCSRRAARRARRAVAAGRRRARLGATSRATPSCSAGPTAIRSTGARTTPRWFDESGARPARGCSGARRRVAGAAPRARPRAPTAIADLAAARAFFEAAAARDKRIVVYDGLPTRDLQRDAPRASPIAEAVAWLSAHAR